MILKNPIGLKIALGENPISTYGKDSKCPVTRMGTASLIRELFMKAQDYMIQKEKGSIVQRDIKLEAVIPLLKGDISLKTHAHRADDIVTAIRIAEEFKIEKLAIEHGTEAHLVKDYLREKNIPVAFGPMLTPRIKMEVKGRKYNSIDQSRAVAIHAMSEGLSANDTLKSITVNPAEILDADNKIGKLKEGYDADIVIFNGNPFNIKSRVSMTIINGEIGYRRQNSHT